MANVASPSKQTRAHLDEVEPGSETRISSAVGIMRYVATSGMVAIATLVAYGLDSGGHIPNLSLVYVLPVIVAGMTYGMGESLCAAVIGAFAYNFFFTEPRYSLMVDDPAYIWAIALLFIVGVIVSTIAFNAKHKAADVATMTHEVMELQRFSTEIAASRNVDAILATSARSLAAIFGVSATAVALKSDEIDAIQSSGDLEPGMPDYAAAKSALQMGAASRARTYPNQDSRFDFWPVGNSIGQPVVIGVAFNEDDRPSAQDELVDIVRNTMALALDRAALSHPPTVVQSAGARRPDLLT